MSQLPHSGTPPVQEVLNVVKDLRSRMNHSEGKEKGETSFAAQTVPNTGSYLPNKHLSIQSTKRQGFAMKQPPPI